MLRLEESFGFVAVAKKDDSDHFLLVRHTDGHWGFPKGHREGSETSLETAQRELKEECGISHIRVISEHVFSETYIFERNGLATEKTNTFYLGTVEDMTVIPQEGEILECRFATSEEAEQLPLFDDTKRILKEAQTVLAQLPARG